MKQVYKGYLFLILEKKIIFGCRTNRLQSCFITICLVSHNHQLLCVDIFADQFGQFSLLIVQNAQLSQRDRAAGCVIVFAKSRTLELGDNDLRTLGL